MINAAQRELLEETGIYGAKYKLLNHKVFFLEKTDEDIDLFLFKATLQKPCEVILNSYEHTDSLWVNIKNISNVTDIIPDIPAMLTKLISE